jgi:histidyl-tRNA synthetase
MSKFQRPRGTRDFTPEELAPRRALADVFRRTLEDFGFAEVQTPTFEHTELFTAKSGEAVLDQIYAFEDKGERDLTLRPEVTAPVMRFYANELQHRPKPLKLWYEANCFRYERPQSGRYREFWQFGAELVGPETPEAHAEVVGAAATMLLAAGLEDFEVRLGHIGILDAFIDPLDVEEETKDDLYRLVDDGDLEALDETLAEAGEPEGADTIRALADTREPVDTADAGDDDVLDEAREVVAGDEAAEEALDGLVAVTRALAPYGLEAVDVDLGVARGLDYYTGPVFEIHHPDLGAQSQVCGGGAYELASLFGAEPVGTSGFGMGFDRALLALQEEQDFEPEPPRPRVYVIPIGEEARGAALELVNDLRWNGVAADIDLSRRGPSKNLDHANTLGAPTALLVGSEELEAGEVTVKDMESGDQRQVPRDEVLDDLLG